MKRCVIILALLTLALPTMAPADTLTLSGTLTGLPKENIFYDFTITSIFLNQFGGEVEDGISGSYLITSKSGALLASQILTGSENEFIFQAVNDSIVLQEFAVFKPNTDPYVLTQLIAKYDFLATGLNQVQIVFIRGNDPQVIRAVGTPEPGTWTLLLTALVAGLLGWRWLKPRATKPAPPILMTDWGPVTEWARKQAALNIKADSDTRTRVMQIIRAELEARRAGLVGEAMSVGIGADTQVAAWHVSDADVEAEMKRRYPEAYE
jgi:hypothetical protein